MTDLEIASAVTPKKIAEIAAKLGLSDEEIEPYGHYKAKLAPKKVDKAPMSGKLILVTAINPTPMGEGKTTVSIGLADGLSLMGKKACLALREPSLGPVFGVKGGATGGGMAQVVPMEDINLHFTGDLHAITAANNLLAALLDNHIQQGNELQIDARKILFKRCVDLNDRALRNIVVGLGGVTCGVPREDGFTITAASEIMALLCLASDMDDLKKRIAKITLGYTLDDKPVTVSELGGVDAAVILLKEAMKPNLVQTLEGTPAILHGGPFANIAHGCNSVIATRMALELSDYVVTEAGFGADLGAEKFFDIKCRLAGFSPSVTILVATVRSLKYNGLGDDLKALKRGLSNLTAHIQNLKNVFGARVVVAINKFLTDTEAELECIKEAAVCEGVEAVVVEAWEFGGRGTKALASATVKIIDGEDSPVRFAYDLDMSIVEKIEAIGKNVYGAAYVEFSDRAKAAIKTLEKSGDDKLPVCIAKTQYSFSDDAGKLGRPKGFTLKIGDIIPRTGAGFIVAQAGNMLLMPGLSKTPAAMKMTIDKNSKIDGLF